MHWLKLSKPNNGGTIYVNIAGASSISVEAGVTKIKLLDGSTVEVFETPDTIVAMKPNLVTRVDGGTF